MARIKKQPKIPTVKQLPSGNWHSSVMVEGKRISVTKDSYDECLSCVMELVSKRITGERIKQGNLNNITLRQAIDKYIESRNSVLSPSTVVGYKRIQKHGFKTVMDRNIAEIDNWQELVNLESKKCAPKTVRNRWMLIKSVLNNYNIEVPKVVLPQPEPIDYDFLEPEEIKPFLKMIHGDIHELTFLLALHSLRISEIMALDAKKSFKGGVIRVRGAVVETECEDGKVRYVKKATNKTGTSARDIPIMIPRLQELIASMPPEELQKMIPHHADTPRKRLEKLLRDNRHRKIGLHDLRRTFASLGYHLKLSELEIMRFGGWSDVTTLRRVYMHLAQSDLKKAESRIREFYS